MAQNRIEISRSRLHGLMAVGLLGCATLTACFSGPGLEPPGGGGTPAMGDDRGGITGPAAGENFGQGAGAGGLGGAPPEDNDAFPPDAVGGAPTTADAGDAGADAGAADAAAADAGTDAAIPATCEEMEAEFADELARAQDCSGGEACAHTFVGTGCSDGLLPMCGVAHRDGADLTRLSTLDHAYRKGACKAGEPVACATCVAPSGATCEQGRCVTQQ